MEILLIICIWIVLLVLIGKMASARGRSEAGYIALGLILSPLVSIIILLILGKTDERKEEEEEERIRREEYIRAKYRNTRNLQ